MPKSLASLRPIDLYQPVSESVYRVPRWHEYRVPIGEYAIVKHTVVHSQKTYYHLMVNSFHADALLAIADQLLKQHDRTGSGKRLAYKIVSPTDYGVTTTQNSPWTLFEYVTKGDGELLSSKTSAVAVRCVFWENNRDSKYSRGVSLTGMKSIPNEAVKDMEMDTEQFEQTVL